MIGKMRKVHLREVWKNEARDFTTWLYENLQILSEELEMNLNPSDKEKRIGSFFIDITAEDGSGRKVIIENQLEKTDHDHLGKIITYCTNFGADIAIWISANPRPEHQKAIEWLNETGTGVTFYLVRIDAYQIDKSRPAPKFTIVTGPSETSELISTEKKQDTERYRLRREFWNGLLSKMNQKTDLFSNISAGTDYMLQKASGIPGISYIYWVNNNTSSTVVYIDRGKESHYENRNIFKSLYAEKAAIEKPFGNDLKWMNADTMRCCMISNGVGNSGFQNQQQWDQLQDALVDSMIKLEKSIKPHLNSLEL